MITVLGIIVKILGIYVQTSIAPDLLCWAGVLYVFRLNMDSKLPCPRHIFRTLSSSGIRNHQISK